MPEGVGVGMTDRIPDNWTRCACCNKVVRTCTALRIRVGQFDRNVCALVALPYEHVCRRCVESFAFCLPIDHAAELVQGIVNRIARVTEVRDEQE